MALQMIFSNPNESTHLLSVKLQYINISNIEIE